MCEFNCSIISYHFYYRFEEEQRRLKEREAAKLRQAEAMREVLEAAERLAKEQKKFRRKSEKSNEENSKSISSRSSESNILNENQFNKNCPNANSQQNLTINNDDVKDKKVKQEILNEKDNNNKNNNNNNNEIFTDNNDNNNILEDLEQNNIKPVQVPVSKDVAIVLSGRLEDSELLNKANLQLVNLVLTPTPRQLENNSNTNLSVGLNSLIQNIGNSNFTSNSFKIPPMIEENRLLTPSKYRITNGRDFGTQTDVENDPQDFLEKMQNCAIKDTSVKDHKDATNASKRDIEK